MTKLTRRGLLGGTAAAALVACGAREDAVIAERPDALTDSRTPYAGEVAFNHGVASGDPLQSAVIIWTRVTPLTGEGGPIPVAYGVFEDERWSSPSFSASPRPSGRTTTR